MKDGCECIQSAQCIKKIDIKNDKKCQSSYWLLVFPTHIEFQSDIFTPVPAVNENSTLLERETVTFVHDKKKSIIEKMVHGLAVT